MSFPKVRKGGNMKRFSRICAFALTLAFAFGMVYGCNNGSNYQLKISFYDGGYGTAWAYALAQKYEEETGVTVTVEPSKTLQADIPNMLQNGTDNDILFSHGIIWELPALQGRIEPLNDLYEMECDNGTVEDRILPELLEDCKLKFDGNYYKLPWTNGAGGLVYNKVLFDKYGEQYGWKVPETYEELVELCEKVEEAAIVVNPEAPAFNQRTLKPFAWSSETYYWDYLVFDWWAQLEGIESINNYKKLESVDVLDPSKGYKFPEAVQLWVDLIKPHEVNGVMRDYSIEGSSGRDYMSAQNDFINGYALMMPNAQWFESEMRDNIDPEVCEMIMMPAPVVPGAKTDENGDVIRVNYQVGGGDSIIIPACSQNKEEAKRFLAFMCREDNAKLFTERTLGVMLGLKYESLDGIADRYLTSFSRSVFEINTNSTKFNLYSQNNMVLNNKITLEWADTGINEYANLYAGTSTVDQIFKTRFDTISANFAQWKAESDAIYGG